MSQKENDDGSKVKVMLIRTSDSRTPQPTTTTVLKERNAAFGMKKRKLEDKEEAKTLQDEPIEKRRRVELDVENCLLDLYR